MKCYQCNNKKRKQDLSISSFIPHLTFSKCYNCKNKYIVANFLNREFLLKKISLTRF